jgi:O-antigen ligase
MTQIKQVARLNQIKTRSFAATPGMYWTLATILGVLVLEVLAAALYLAPQQATLGLVLIGLGVPIALLIWHRPEFGLLALLFLTSSFVQTDILDLRLPIGGGMDIRDLALIGLFGLVGLRQLTRGTVEVSWWPVGGPLLLFLVMAVFSAFYAIVFAHVESNWALGDLRILSLYTTFFITLWSIKRPEQLKTLLVGLFIIADLTTAVVYSQQFLGAGNPLLFAMQVTRDWRVYQTAGVVRVIPAGHVLMHFMWFVALGLLLFAWSNRRLRVFCVAQLLFIGGGHLLTYTRAQWMAMAVGLGLVFFIFAPRFKQHLVKAVAIAFCVAILFAGVFSGSSLSTVSAPPFVVSIAERLGSLLTPSETLDTGSLQWRDFEIDKASLAIGEQPLTGVGLGGRYRNVTAFQGEAKGWLTGGSIASGRISRFTRYVHNSYVSIAVKMGIPGLIVMLWFCAAVLIKGFQVYRVMPDSEYKGVVLGVLVGFAGLLLWCYYHAHLIKAESTPTIGVMVALVGSIAYIYGRGSASRPIRDRSLPPKE